jgi:cyclopropane-fatty-acyl-phospholipid synthase
MYSREVINKLATRAGINLEKDVKINDDRFYDRVFRDNSLGLGESYMLGWWEAGDKTLDELFYQICKADVKNELANLSLYSKINLTFSWLYKYWFPVRTIEDSKVVAIQHYDLDKEIYEAMLEPMVYSCGYYTNSNNTLKEAQINKMEIIKKKLNIRPGMKVLDIGCGWGELAAYFGKDNIFVDAITISNEQYKYAKEKFENDFIKFYLSDYRLFEPSYQYDAIVSVGMFEHVNSNNYIEFMKIVHKLLKPAGLFLLHTIGSIKTSIVCDKWINKYIFPNSCLPSLAQISSSSEGYFVIEDVHNFGSHYDKTLMHWYKNFILRFDEINKKLAKPLNKEFYRMWTYYLLSCAGSFRARKIQLYQVVLAKDPTNVYQRPIL